MNKVKIDEPKYHKDGENYYREYRLQESDYGKGLMHIARTQLKDEKQYVNIRRLKNGKVERITNKDNIDFNDILLLPTPAPKPSPSPVKTFKAKHVAVASNNQDVWVLDDNGRLWSPRLHKGTGQKMEEWFDEPVGDAVALAVDGNLGLWKLDSKGHIAYREPNRPGEPKRDWYNESLKDSKGNFVKAVQISAGGDMIAVVDDKQRLWRRYNALRGTSGTEWMLDKSSANVK